MSASAIVAVAVRQSGMIDWYGSNSGLNMAASSAITDTTACCHCLGTPCGRPPTLPAINDRSVAPG